MSYLSFVVIVVPALMGLAAATAYGPNRGVLGGAIVTLMAVFVLLIFQVTPPNAASALGLMQFELIRWAPAFLVGAAIGSLIFRARSRKRA